LSLIPNPSVNFAANRAGTRWHNVNQAGMC
jgi:hypothetical protein